MNNQFNQILNGQKAQITEKKNQVHGNLIKWKEGNKIGTGASGEVF